MLAARRVLIKNGISNVKVGPLAKALGVTSGSFYWHFSRRQALYDALLQDWYDTNTAPLVDAVETAGNDRASNISPSSGCGCWSVISIPNTTRRSATGPGLEESVRRSAQGRPEPHRLLQRIYEGFGYEGLEAEMRARVTYYHQVDTTRCR